MHRTLWPFDVLDRAPKSCFARRNHGAHLVPAKFKSSVRSTTNPSSSSSGWRPQMARRLVTETIPSGFFSRYRKACLLYTSDAADDLLCVDLGGRRIIKKK